MMDANIERWIALLDLEPLESFCRRSLFSAQTAALLYEGLSFFTVHREVARHFLDFAAEASNQGHEPMRIIAMLLPLLKPAPRTAEPSLN